MAKINNKKGERLKDKFSLEHQLKDKKCFFVMLPFTHKITATKFIKENGYFAYVVKADIIKISGKKRR